jgi:hypothetical protein
MLVVVKAAFPAPFHDRQADFCRKYYLMSATDSMFYEIALKKFEVTSNSIRASQLEGGTFCR